MIFVGELYYRGRQASVLVGMTKSSFIETIGNFGYWYSVTMKKCLSMTFVMPNN